MPSNLLDQKQFTKEFEDELVFEGYQKQCRSSYIDLDRGSRSEATLVDLEIDLMDMILFDPFLGENFIKYLFRYYSFMSQFVKEIFIDMYSDGSSDLMVFTKSPSDFVINKLEKNLWLKLNLRLSHFPTSIKRIDPQALLSNNLL